MERSPKVARPSASVVWVVVPLRAPSPEAICTVTETPARGKRIGRRVLQLKYRLRVERGAGRARGRRRREEDQPGRDRGRGERHRRSSGSGEATAVVPYGPGCSPRMRWVAARPSAPVTTVSGSTAPPPSADQVTWTLATGLPNRSVTFTTSESCAGSRIVPVCASPDSIVTRAGWPSSGRTRSPPPQAPRASSARNAAGWRKRCMRAPDRGVDNVTELEPSR